MLDVVVTSCAGDVLEGILTDGQLACPESCHQAVTQQWRE